MLSVATERNATVGLFVHTNMIQTFRFYIIPESYRPAQSVSLTEELYGISQQYIPVTEVFPVVRRSTL